MSHKVILDPLAKQDLDDNIDWYNLRQPGLGNRFYGKVKDTLRLVGQNPFGFPVKYKDTRAVPVNTFPFTVHYLVDKKKKVVAVLSIFKTPQDPEKWKKRT